MQILLLIIGLIVGWFANNMMMRMRFKEKLVDLKIKVYGDSINLIVNMRNNLVRSNAANVTLLHDELDRLYARGQELLADVCLVSENEEIPKHFDEMLEFLYRTDRNKFVDSSSDKLWSDFKSRALGAVNLMRHDLKDTARLTLKDFNELFLKQNKGKAESDKKS